MVAVAAGCVGTMRVSVGSGVCSGCVTAVGVVSTTELLQAASSATSTSKTKDLRTRFQLTILLSFACVSPFGKSEQALFSFE
jgi:hypothetical protein